ncbi:MAG: F0F1 ATP synthase subunit beta, partial [Carnobacterium sp.]
MSIGQIVQVIGPVVDVEFPLDGSLPDINNALIVKKIKNKNKDTNEVPETVVLEVALELGDGIIRTIAMESTDGLQRGMDVEDTGKAISV